MIQMSESAYNQLKTVRKNEGRDETYFLRVEVKRGGCSGMSYKMDFDNTPRENDKEFPHGDEKIVVDTESLLYLLGLELDYQGGLNGKGFVFNNPSASKTCGCGASFNV